MTPEELKKLCDTATAGGPSLVDTYKRTEARAELRFLGFKSESVGIARARSYAALEIDNAKLRAALEEIAHGENTSYLACPGPPHCDGSHYPTCPVAITVEALATGGKK